MEIMVSNKVPIGWDEGLRKREIDVGICQSRYWAEVIRILDKATPYYFQIKDSGDSVLAQALILKRYRYDRDRQRRLFPLPYIECLDGPVIFDHARSVESTQLILRHVLRVAKRNLTTHIHLIPSHVSRYASDEKMANVYQEFGFEAKKWGTYLVDLKKDEEELFKLIMHSARKCIKKCQREGLKVIAIKSYEEFEERYWQPYVKAEAYFGRKANLARKDIWGEDKDNYYHYYIVEDKQGETVAVLGMYIFNGVATEIASSIMPQAYEQKIPAQDLIHWEMMLEAKRLGAHTFDLAGVNPNPQTPKEEGIRRFKGKWGGKYVEYYVYRKNMIPMLKTINKLIKSLPIHRRNG
jgi:lipid II:glycine glycyltransferase (peptidoglycan interpeptide bridge formation enzyme)